MEGLRTTRIALAIILIVMALSVLVLFASWLYTSSQLALARSHGAFPTPEQAMQAKIDRGYIDVSRVDILYAGPNSFDGSQPHVWYVIAEVRAAARAGGSELGSNGCDAPGSFFLQIKKGWVHVPEGAFPEVIGFWMKVFGLAGPGQSNPSIDWAPSQPARFCLNQTGT
ncbi:MAG: hypothetical protein E3J69_12990 [Anaerolineales bacterium]|jgi:hypothetical protein|nr:MAG: hypothetical protein E3J69_12990 [Anaerolineales bacterium]